MSNKALRQWQAEAVQAVVGGIKDRPVVSAIMGAGKSIAIAELAGRMSKKFPVIVTVPTQQLVRQQAKAMRFWLDVPIGEYYTHSKTTERITVVCQNSLDTLPAFGLSICWIADECHKTECDTVIDWASRTEIAYRVGFTATPYRSSQVESITLFDRLVYEYTAADAVRDGVVVPVKLQHATHDGDISDVCREWIVSQTGKGVVNSASISDCELFAMTVEAAGMPCRVVHSGRTRAEVDAALAWLRETERGCIAYVNMLSEGFDEPSIQWMCLRRRVGSRVRFAQEVGRGLRAHPGKTHCDIFDPGDLFERHSLSWEECLGAPEPVEKDAPEAWAVRLMTGLDTTEKERELAKSRVKAKRWLSATRLNWQMAGLLELKVTSTSWRSAECTNKQLQTMIKAAPRLAHVTMPDRIRDNLRHCYVDAPNMTKGNVSDLIGIIFTLSRLGAWPEHGE